jgi:hypothetical protein
LSFPNEPGEWLLLMQGETVIATVVIGFILGLAPQDPASEVLLLSTPLLAFALIGLIPALRYRGDGPWRLFIVTFGLLYISPVLGAVVGIAGGFLLLGLFTFAWFVVLMFALATFLIAVINDFSLKAVRGWAHWTGVWSLAVLVLFYGMMAIFAGAR